MAAPHVAGIVALLFQRGRQIKTPRTLTAEQIRKILIASSSQPSATTNFESDWGFGREGLSRRIAFYKCVALVEGTNIVRRELGLPEARIRAADPGLYFASSGKD